MAQQNIPGSGIWTIKKNRKAIT